MATRMSTVVRGEYRITFVPRTEPGHPCVRVSNAVAAAADAEFADFLARDARGEVSDYTRMNEKNADVKTKIATRVLPLVTTTRLGVTFTAPASLVFDRHAGCRLCPCTPGVVAPGLRKNGVRVDVVVEAA